MHEHILININPYETRAAIIHQAELQELHIERDGQKGLVGNIYLGKVIRVLPGMQSAFIDIGLDKAAFLHVADLRESRSDKANPKTSGNQIEKILFLGQSIMVQVIKDPLGNKGARLTTQISLAGRMLVYLPYDPHIGVSQRIENEEERQQLKNLLTSIIPEDEKGGYIIRTHAGQALQEDMRLDTDYLTRLWSSILHKLKHSTCPALLHRELTLTQRLMRDVADASIEDIYLDHQATYQELLLWAEQYTPSVAHKLKFYDGERPIFDLYNVDNEIQASLSRRVDLKSGGYLIIDQTEALTTIDVNTGGYVGGKNFDETIFKTNLEATQSIARQLRLRNLGGIIIVDFIDMENTDHQTSVLNEFTKALSLDRSKTTLSGFSQLGLVEMTRKRTRESLAQLLCEPCPACQATGHLKTAKSICYEILREIAREARQFNPQEFKLIASQSVIDLFLEDESQNLALLGDQIKKPISLHVEASYHQEQYDIVLV